ncbi:ATP-binding cassette subfamily C protein CydD [Weissella beninensis]|uniref:Thiol reductant ABC exporter subunit CydD n=1 Tax=Periweissella beninensis TaxID=504936 RepID=A0ABT0VJ14_9LACO|nr:thiol reductant ABC exporter subunit CydD [Periweissella beninensis]MBM7545083.1 ATP-binding cassette subfamily C protein CydD [Periweissella beninensis]MCM2436387.1 thiol reductant ABC exporter subunit CydD [Periweissella beninensis]
MIDRRLFKLPGIRKTLGMLVVFTILQAFSVLFQGKYLSESIVTLWQQRSLNEAFMVIGLFVVAFVTRHLLTVVKNYTIGNWVEQTTIQLRHDLLVKFGMLGPAPLQDKGTGNLVTLSLEGMDKVQNYFMLVLIKMCDMMIIPWILLVYLGTVDWQEAIFLFVIYPVVIIFMIILGYAAQAKADKEYMNFVRLSNHFVDALRGLPTLKQLGLSKRYAENIYDVSEDYRKSVLSTLKIGILSTFTLDFFTTLSIAVVAVFLGLSLINGHIQLLPALIMLVLAPEYFMPLRNFANDYHATLDGKNALTDVLEILERPTIENGSETKVPSWQQDSTLEITNLTVAYEKNVQPALNIPYLKLGGYQKIGIIGKSGSGKSTLLNLLGGLLSANIVKAQTIKVNGTTINSLQTALWQKQLQYIPQKPYIFHASLADNIAFYYPKAGKQAVAEAIKLAGLFDWVATLPQGMETLIGEGGQSVSGGQAQRIALARAFLTPNRHVLLFDEPTAHLDIETEVALKETMLPLFEDKLVLFATHRLHWINQMDYILVIKDGKIVEQGTPAQLNNKKGELN